MSLRTAIRPGKVLKIKHMYILMKNMSDKTKYINQNPTCMQALGLGLDSFTKNNKTFFPFCFLCIWRLSGSGRGEDRSQPEGLVENEEGGLVVAVQELDINDVLHTVGWYHLQQTKTFCKRGKSEFKNLKCLKRKENASFEMKWSFEIHRSHSIKTFLCFFYEIKNLPKWYNK